jgi:hypothetical protein
MMRNYFMYDILVVGGGTAGTIAAIQAARAGAKTVLVECGCQLGGTITTGSVPFPGLFHAHGKQVISGIGWELVEECVALNGDTLPDFTIPCGRQHPKHQILLNPSLYALLAEEKCRMAGVKLRYYETPIGLEENEKYWIVDLAGKGTQTTVQCRQIIDCTGNASITKMAGYALKRSKICQPGTIRYTLGGYDPDSVDWERVQKLYDKILTDRKNEGLIDKTWVLPGKGFSHIHWADSTTSESHTQANIHGRTALLEMLRLLKSLPGLESTIIETMGSETSVRETNRIEGEHEITVDEYLRGELYEDSLCYSFYPIDLHDKSGVEPRYMDDGVVPSIPLRALIPKGSRNFLAAGRCASSDQLANSALRVQASCMAMGQAAGAVATLAVRRGVSPRNVPISEIRKLLFEQGAIVPS